MIFIQPKKIWLNPQRDLSDDGYLMFVLEFSAVQEKIRY
jgi:hypothetical protein